MSPWPITVRVLMAVAVIVGVIVLALPDNPLRPVATFQGGSQP